MTNAEKEEYLKKCTGCLSCKYFLGEDKYCWGHCILKEKEEKMTNADKYKVELSKDEYEVLLALREFKKSVGEAKKEGVLEVKPMPILTEDERVILKNVDKTYKYIHKEYGSLRISLASNGLECETFDMFDHLFQFIKERRRIRDKGVIR